MFRATFPDNYSIECFLTGECNERLLTFFLRDPEKNILIEFQHQEYTAFNEVFELAAMIPLYGHLFAIVISRQTIRDRYREPSYKNYLLIFNAKEGVRVSNTELSLGEGDYGGYVAGIIYANGLIYVGIKDCVYIYNIKEMHIKEKRPVFESVNSMGEENANIIAMRLIGNNKIVIATQKNILSYNLSGDLTNLKDKGIKLKELRPDIGLFKKVTLLPQGTLIGFGVCRNSAFSLKNFQTDEDVDLPVPANLSISNKLGSTILPTGNVAIAFQEQSQFLACSYYHIVIYDPMNGNIVEHFKNINKFLFNYSDDNLSYYVEYLELMKVWMRDIQQIIAEMLRWAPTPLSKLICSYICCFSLSDLQMLYWCSANAFQWNYKHLCVTFKKDKARNWPVIHTKQNAEGIKSIESVEKAQLLLKDEKTEFKELIVQDVTDIEEKERESKQFTAFKKIYQALYDGETTIWKGKNFLTGKESYSNAELENAIHLKARQNAEDRAVRAWSLALIYYNNPEENELLFTKIYKQSFEHSGLFKRSCITGHTFFKYRTLDYYVKLIAREKIDEHKEDNTRGGKIYRALAC